MTNYLQISVGNLLLDVSNYRIVKQHSQKAARDAIIAEQGKKLIVLAKDMLTIGTNPSDLPIVIDAEDGNQNYIVIEGNRRLTAISLLMEPSLVKDPVMHRAFVRMSKDYQGAIPKVLYCVLAPDRKTARLWAHRKHANGLGGSGTEQWTAMAKARAAADQGEAVPELDVVNFLLSKQDLAPELRRHLEGSKFNLTTLERLITTKELREAAGLTVTHGKIVSAVRQEWVKSILTDVVGVIATGKFKGRKWTEREIDTDDKRQIFVDSIVASHIGRRAAKPWAVTGEPTVASASAAQESTGSVKSTPSTGDQVNLIPRKFKLALPAGKINDVFVELKRLDVNSYRHAVSVLFRVFLEFTLDEYIKKHAIELPTDHQHKPVDKLSIRLSRTVDHVKKSGLMTARELKPVDVAIGNKDSFLAPETLNAYVHSPLMNPDPLVLKTTWLNVQLFVERLWTGKPEKL